MPHSRFLLASMIAILAVGILIGYSTAQSPTVSHTWGEVLNVLVTTSQLDFQSVTGEKIAPHSIDDTKIIDGSITKVDVDDEEICVTGANGTPSEGCPLGSKLGCQLIYAHDPVSLGGPVLETAIDIPQKCFFGTCSITAEVYVAGGGLPSLGSVLFTQFSGPPPFTTTGRWTLSRRTAGPGQPFSDPVQASGTNGDTTSTQILNIHSPALVLYDDLSTIETEADQWSLKNFDVNNVAQVWVC